MADITYLTGANLINAIGQANQAVSGMSHAEAAAALGATAQAQAGGGALSAFPIQYQEYGQVSLEAQYAAQMWEYWQTVAGATGTTVLGAAGAAALEWAQGALIGTGTGTLAATAGLLTLSVPTAVALATPLLGVGLGIALYETNPELWTKISNACVDFVNEGTQTISALVTEAGQVLLPKGLVDSIKSLFEEENIPMPGTSTGGGASSNLNTSPVAQPIPIANEGFVYDTNGTLRIHFLSGDYTVTLGHLYGNYGYFTFIAACDHPGETLRYQQYQPNGTPWSYVSTIGLNSSYTYNGKTVYFTFTSTALISPYAASMIPYFGDENGDQKSSQIAWTMVYGDIIPPGEYQPGTSKWSGKEVDLDVIGTWPAFDPNFGTTQPYYPVSLKSLGSTPGTNVDPDDPDYDPTSPLTSPEYPLLNPYIPPVVNPEIQWPDVEELPAPSPEELQAPGIREDPVAPAPVPNLNPELDPALDPFAEPVPGTEPCPEPAPDPATELAPPQSGGLSPDIVFPIPGVPFPSIVPAGSDTPLEPGVSGQPGFIQVYNPTYQQFVDFGRWLWVTYADATIDKIWNNPFDGIIGAHELYATPSKDGYSTIRSGFLDSGIGSIIVRQRYTQINCGSMVIPEYYGNYLDYSPYSKAYVYLPFIGIVDVDVDDIVGHAVNITYHVDSYNGSCIAQITCAKEGYTNTLYQFSGNCSVEVPMAGGSQAAIKAAMMTANAYQNAAQASANASLVGGIGSGLASIVGGTVSLAGSLTGTGGVGQIASGIASMASGVANAEANRAYGQAQHTAQMLSGKSNVQHSGSFGASHGAMGIKTPYIILRRPIQVRVNNYNELYGYPAHKQVIVGNCTGFLRCREVHVISSLATDAEKTLIEQLLTTGVYVTE